jgi:predicted SAM-dependent methyltransferase
MSPKKLRAALRKSPEYKDREINTAALNAVHGARLAWVHDLPAAQHIVDLGGSSTSHPAGALVQMGYPHTFEELIIVDLPQDDRHSTFRNPTEVDDVVETESGTVRYVYRPMTDLADMKDESVDLVVSGQSFEHITPADGEVVLDEVHRILTPEGLLALDTPNRALTRIQMRDLEDEFINPDHKVEYEHHEMLTLFTKHGFEVVMQRGLNHLPETARSGEFDVVELANSAPVHEDIERSYLLAYIARRAG